jgi:hypothetical protein
MKKQLISSCALFTFIAINFSLKSMEQLFSAKDLIKAEKSAPYASQTIDIAQTLIDLNTQYIQAPDNDENEKQAFIIVSRELRKSILAMQLCNQSTYFVLNEASNIWLQLTKRNPPRSKNRKTAEHYKKVLEEHEKLHNFYLQVLEEAYPEISKEYSTQVTENLAQLWHHIITIFTQDYAFSNKTKCEAGKMLFSISEMLACIRQSPANTFHVVKTAHTLANQSFPSDFKPLLDTKENKYIRTKLSLIKTISDYYNQITS